eukprot:350724-Chlamydomonas_euryale.AAC.10
MHALTRKDKDIPKRTCMRLDATSTDTLTCMRLSARACMHACMYVHMRRCKASERLTPAVMHKQHAWHNVWRPCMTPFSAVRDLPAGLLEHSNHVSPPPSPLPEPVCILPPTPDGKSGS